ncbi:hypothetical protein ACWER6_11975 [Streptomyces sp. NPDC004009]
MIWWGVIGLATATTLPWGVAMLRGWAPPQATRGRWSPARTRVQGVAVLVLYLALLVLPVLRLSDLPRADADDVPHVASPSLFFLAFGLQGGAALHDWFSREMVRDRIT